jgi:hypothetical protein
MPWTVTSPICEAAVTSNDGGKCTGREALK